MEMERIGGNEMQNSFIVSWQNINETYEVEDTTMEDANTYQKSREATRGREAAMIGSEPSKEQQLEFKLKERIHLLDA